MLTKLIDFKFVVFFVLRLEVPVKIPEIIRKLFTSITIKPRNINGNTNKVVKCNEDITPITSRAPGLAAAKCAAESDYRLPN